MKLIKLGITRETYQHNHTTMNERFVAPCRSRARDEPEYAGRRGVPVADIRSGKLKYVQGQSQRDTPAVPKREKSRTEGLITETLDMDAVGWQLPFRA
jgi:hypothetical protein